MLKNVGNLDRTIRLVIGAVIAILGIYFQSWFGLIAIIPIGTALINYCPLYSILGMNSCKKE